MHDFEVEQMKLSWVFETSEDSNIWWNEERIWIKDAGFVYESLQIETNRVIWDFCFYETNPRYESFEKRSTNWIHDTNP